MGKNQSKPAESAQQPSYANYTQPRTYEDAPPPPSTSTSSAATSTHHHSASSSIPTTEYGKFTPPQVIGLPEDENVDANGDGRRRRVTPAQMLILTEPLVSKLAKEMPPPYRQAWKLLFSSRLHGHSFSRLHDAIDGRGACLIVVKEQGSRGHLFGGFNASSWTSVEAREKEALSAAASRARSNRTGVDYDVGGRPSGQAPNFFGTKECFVFTSGDLQGGQVVDSEIKVWHASTRPNANSNFMYLFSNHSIAEHNGIGMGSDKENTAGEFSWFLDRYLSKGRSCLGLCPTFNSCLLTEDEEFKIDSVEAYAVDPSAFLDAEDDEEGGSIRNHERASVDRALMELNGHTFYDPNAREDC